MEKINKNDTIAQALQKNPKAGEILFKEGLYCVGCGFSHYETLEQGCMLHGLDVDKVIKNLNSNYNKSSKKIFKSKKEKTIKKIIKKSKHRKA
jgi:hybrid cluster-associated redox disulfide protein